MLVHWDWGSLVMVQHPTKDFSIGEQTLTGYRPEKHKEQSSLLKACYLQPDDKQVQSIQTLWQSCYIKLQQNAWGLLMFPEGVDLT